MKQSNDILEQILQNSFEEYSVPEFKNSWEKIRTKFLKKKLLQFSFKNFNIYTIIFLPIMVIIPIAIIKSSQNINHTQPQSPIEVFISDTIYQDNDSVEECKKRVTDTTVSTKSTVNTSHNSNAVENTKSKNENVLIQKDDSEDSLPLFEIFDTSKNKISNSDTTMYKQNSKKKKVIVVQKAPVIVYDTIVKKNSK